MSNYCKRPSAATEGGPQFTRSERELKSRIILRKQPYKLTNSATGRWEYRASFNLKTRSEWALESTYRAIISRSISASPRQRVNLSVPPRLLPVVVYIQGVYGFCARNMGRIRFLRPTTDRVVTQTTNPITVALWWMNLSRKPKRSSFA
jgi:hypothetical protein